MDWFLYDNFLRHERVNEVISIIKLAPFIMRYVENSGFEFYLIMQVIAIQYITNTFSSNFVMIEALRHPDL